MRIHAELTADLNGFQRGAVLHALAALDVVGLIRDGADTCERACERLGADASALARLLDAAVRFGLLAREDDATYRVTERGALLDPAHPMSVHPYARLSVEQYWPAWARIAEAVRTGETAFDKVFGCTPWEYRRDRPEQGAIFDTWQGGESRKVLGQIMQRLDLSMHRTVADIAGGSGALVEACLERWPHLRATLFEQPHTLAARQHRFGERLQLVAGDFFREVPVAADCLLLKSVLHDWGDAEAVAILSNCRRAMRDDTRLVIVERVLCEGVSDGAYMIDLHMLLVTGGRERTLAQYAALARRAGIEVAGMTRTAGDFSLVECRAAS
ncbi:MAG TPA: methyltransferase [Ramlibacter sp.]|nr:methyltransferase [Ramlibacter sp.]